MVRDRWLADVAARGEVAGARLGLGGELPDDRESGGIREGRQEADLRVEVGGLRSCHARSISFDFDIDKIRYGAYIDECRYRHETEAREGHHP